MTPPDKSSPREIDLFSGYEASPPSRDRSLPRASGVVPEYRQHRFHSIQLALVIGLFAGGGLICSIFLVDGNDDFLRLRYWPRKSYRAPVLATPQRPAIVPAVPQRGPLRPNGEEKNAALQDRGVGAAFTQQNSVLRY